MVGGAELEGGVDFAEGTGEVAAMDEDAEFLQRRGIPPGTSDGADRMAAGHGTFRDMSADNVDAMTAEAGLFQMSWNMESCSPHMQTLFDQYSGSTPLCALGIFAQDVSCSDEDWECYGSGPGFEYQQQAKHCPQFAVETAAIGLRNLRQHWGPINRKEAELTSEADAMFLDIEEILTEIA